MRSLLYLIIPLVCLSGCSLVKAPHSGDFSRVKYRSHLDHDGSEDSQQAKVSKKASEESIKSGPEAFRARGVKGISISGSVDRASNRKLKTPSSEEAENAASIADPEPSKPRSPVPQGASSPEQYLQEDPLPKSEGMGIGNSHKKEELQRSGGLEPMDTDNCLLYFLCFAIPPLAVYMVTGSVGTVFMVSVLLTLLFYVPGIIHALITVNQET
ncbi:MAG: YqaE/Pmp3 family membrane protein [Flavobacteriales bacterium]